MYKFPSVMLRVKRRSQEPPVEYYNAFASKKRRFQSNDKRNATCFRYLGTSSTFPDIENLARESLETVGALGERKLVISPVSAAHVIDSDSAQTKINCHVRISTPATKRSADCIEDDLILIPPAKVLRVIDIDYHVPTEAITTTLNGLCLIPIEAQINKDDDRINEDSGCGQTFVYDVYTASEPLDDLEPPFEGIYEGDSDEFDDRLFDDGEDSDSNSESNWRCDYPDEEDEDFCNKELFTRFDDNESDLDEYRNSSDDDDDDDSSNDNDHGRYIGRCP